MPHDLDWAGRTGHDAASQIHVAIMSAIQQILYVKLELVLVLVDLRRDIVVNLYQS